MEYGCTCGADRNREWLEKHESEVWHWVARYEAGEEVDQEELQAWFDRPMNDSDFITAFDTMPPPPKIQAAIIYRTGAHKKTIFELLNFPKNDEDSEV